MKKITLANVDNKRWHFFKRFVNLFSVMAEGRVHQLVRTFYSFGHIYTYLLEECFKRRNVAIPMLMLALSSHSILWN